MSYYQALIFMCVFGNLVLRETTFALFLDGNKFSLCDQSSTLPGYGILVSHGQPYNRGTVVIMSALNKSLGPFADPKCIWSYKVQGVFIQKEDKVERGSNISWIFSKSGLQKVSVTAQFDNETIKNCTFVNVTDCSFISKVKVSTATGSYNISQNHTDITLNSPGLVNFTVSTHSLIDPYFVCKRLYFFWDFGDGHNTSGKHVEHRYNNTGVFCVVLKIYKVFRDDGGKEFIRNITLKIHVKGKPDASSESTNTVVDVSLVLAIFVVSFVFVICIAAYWFRRRLHRHTEVARFDFRASEFQSDFDEPWPRISCHGNKGFMCRRGSDEHLLNFEQRGHYSSCRKFDDNNPNEKL